MAGVGGVGGAGEFSFVPRSFLVCGFEGGQLEVWAVPLPASPSAAGGRGGRGGGRMATCRAPVSSIKSHNLSINHISIAWEHGTSSSSSSSSSASSSSLDSWRTRVAPGPWGVLALTASDDCTVSMWLVDVTKAGLGVDGSGNKDRDLALESGKGEGESSSSMAGRYGGSPMVHIRRFVFSSPIQRCFFDEKLRGGRGGSGVESDSIIRDPSSSLHSLHCADRMVVGSWGSTLHVVGIVTPGR